MDINVGTDKHEGTADSHAATNRLREEVVTQEHPKRLPTAEEIATGSHISNATAARLCEELGQNVPFDFSACSGFGF